MMYHEGKKVKKVEGVPPQVDQIIKNIEADVESGGHSNSDSKTQTVVGTTTPADPEKARTLGKPTSGL
jgi:hypothetical protein